MLKYQENKPNYHFSQPNGLFINQKADTSSLSSTFLGMANSSIDTLIPFCFISSFIPYSNLYAPSKMLLQETTPPALLLTTSPFDSLASLLSWTVLCSPNLNPQVHDHEDVKTLQGHPLQFFLATSCCWYECLQLHLKSCEPQIGMQQKSPHLHPAVLHLILPPVPSKKLCPLQGWSQKHLEEGPTALQQRPSGLYQLVYNRFCANCAQFFLQSWNCCSVISTPPLSPTRLQYSMYSSTCLALPALPPLPTSINYIQQSPVKTARLE